MKKVFLAVLAIMLSLFLTGCVNSGFEKKEGKFNLLENVPAEESNGRYNAASVVVKTEETNLEQSDDVVMEKSELEVDVSDEIALETHKEHDITDIQYLNKEFIARGSTSFNPMQKERSNNIRLAANYINNLVLYPGEEFSFNRIVGKRTAERGFLPADIFVGQSTAKGYGGGVCQTSSTVCIAVRQTDMKILEQNPHSQRVTYTTIDNEAMINYGTSDFRFVNTYDFPVMIEMSFEGTDKRETIKCEIFALK